MPKPPHSERGQPPQQRQQAPQQVVHQQVRQVQQWSGPLPSPADLEKFNQIIPNGADRIVAMTEKEQDHRIEYEKIGLSATISESRRALGETARYHGFVGQLTVPSDVSTTGTCGYAASSASSSR